ncbi:MAG: TonB-dependent receptor [Ignavibacteriales bacterium]|nr:TonB-dependent receptor [Ignavibacteriales bacterium]
MKSSLSILLLVIIVLLLPAALFGQATLRGVVTDTLTQEKLVGVNVVLVGTGMGNATNIEGEYAITGIPQKVYSIRISCIGYEVKTIEVDFSKNPAKRLDVKLNSTVIQGQEVVVTAQMRGQVAAMNQQIASNTIINVVSEQKIRELPDANAAESIGRLPGVSILRSGGEANKVILRGLSDKFTTVTIDGVKIAATDADSRGVDLSTISQGSLSGIELSKALTPDKDADAIAGSVNLVTKRAPSKRQLQADIKGDYNRLMNSAKQYDLSLRYGERFFDGILGVQVSGNLENRIRSNEQTTINYSDRYDIRPATYFVSNFKLQFVDEVRKRDGGTLLLDVNTPDSGSVRMSVNYNGTQRGYNTFMRNYPTNNAGSTPVYYETEARDQKVTAFNTSVRGENFLQGLSFTWGGAYARSVADLPFDYYLDYFEAIGRRDAAGHATSGMDLPPNLYIQSNPEVVIPYAVNNFAVAAIDSGIFSTERNSQTERSGYLDGKGKYTLGDMFAGEVKMGGKYKYTTRTKESSRLFAPYYLGFAWQPKNLTGTRFDSFYKRYLANSQVRSPSLTDFLDPSPAIRDLFNRYTLNPLMNSDAVREWYNLNKNGTAAGTEYYTDNTADLDYYNITERLGAGYLMNTLNIGRDVTFIAGLRVESESNDYVSRFVPGTGSLGGFPTPTGVVKDTTTKYEETIWLPNFHLTVRPAEFLNVRLAAYKAIARPDYNARLIKLFAQSAASASLIVGNPTLRVSKAWNYEVNTSIFSNTIGLVSVSAFYKEISDDVHILSQGGIVGPRFLDSLGIHWNTALTKGGYQLTVPYNSSKPTKVWGFEFEHQANLSFLPSYLQFLVLSYNFSIVRSEAHLVATLIDTNWVVQHTDFGDIATPFYSNRIIDRVQKLDGQPEFYGNVALGIDVGDFSARMSVFYQGQFNRTFSPGGLTDGITGKYTRWDLTVKQRFSDHVALLMSVSNLMNVEESTYTTNRVYDWTRLNVSQRYGMTADFGVRVDF